MPLFVLTSRKKHMERVDFLDILLCLNHCLLRKIAERKLSVALSNPPKKRGPDVDKAEDSSVKIFLDWFYI